MNSSGISFTANFLIALLPDVLDTLSGGRVSSEKLIESNIRSTIIAIEGKMVDLMEHISCAGEDEPTMAEPGSDTAVKNDSQQNGWVASERHSHEACRVVEGGLNWVHAGS